ncbi:MAG: DUF4129 domain-containing protein [Flavipsychrobacter sp.]|nr:DUF4129 domain-containing protein [Flavipsychrobacter sp.]
MKLKARILYGGLTILAILFLLESVSYAQDKLEMPVQQIDSLKALKDFRYANDPAYWPKKPNEEKEVKLDWLDDFLNSGWPKIIIYVLLIFLLGFILYRILTERNMLLFTKKSTSRKKRDPGPAAMDEPDLDQLLMKAEAQQNYSESVRLQYLKTLHLLKSKGLLDYHPEWTNATYLQQLRNYPHFEQFRQLSRVYEFVCYGGFTADPDKYRLIKQEFLKFHQLV